MSPLLDDIEAFLETHNLGHRSFGVGAVNDGHFVEDLRNGRRVWPETEAKVRAFMKAFKSEAA
jgi:hypothetical protein